MSNLPTPLEDLLSAYGEQWQIQQDKDTGAWSAVARPTVTSQHVLIGYTVDHLRAKLDKANGNGHDGEPS
jgi:hypothetical protein